MRAPFEIIASLGLAKPKGILQVGANVGQEIDYFLQNDIAYAVMIEPLDDPFKTLLARASTIPGYMAVNMLCGSQDGQQVEFHIATNNGESSSILKPARHLADYPWVQFTETVRLNSFTLDSILATVQNLHAEMAQSLDLLYMDVQGAGLDVLKGASAALRQINYIYTEVGLGGGYEGETEVTELMHYLKVWGFYLYELEIGKTGWGEALFIKRQPGLE